MAKLYFTIGLPRGGKSTLCNKWRTYDNYIEENKFVEYKCSIMFQEPPKRYESIQTERRVVVSGDRIRESLYGSLWNQLAEDFVDAIKWTMVRTLLNSGYTVLLDETNTSERNIRKIFEIDINAEFVYVDTPVEVCKKRANETLWKPIDRMHDNLRTLVNSHCSVWEWKKLIGTELPSKGHLEHAIVRLKKIFLEEIERYTNESRNSATQNPELPEVPTTPKPSVSSATCTWTTTIPDVSEYQVW